MVTSKLRKTTGEKDYYKIEETPNLDIGNWNTYQKADTVILLLAKPLAGMGTARYLEQGALGMDDIAKDVDVLYIGPETHNNCPLLAFPFEEIEPGETNPDVFSNVYNTMKKALQRLYSKGKRRLAVACFGYTMFGLEALRRVLNEMNEGKDEGSVITAIAMVIDTAYPDTDEINVKLDVQDRPLNRFYCNGYVSSSYLQTIFTVMSSYPMNIDLLEVRKPRGMTGSIVTTQTYTKKYINFLIENGATPKQEAIKSLSGKITNFENIESDDLIVPLLTSDIWDPDSVNAWMTELEYISCTVGTTNIIQALQKVAQVLNKRVFLPIDEAAVEFIKSLKLENTFLKTTKEKKPAVYICSYKALPQKDHTVMIGSSNAAIGRTGGQANATTVSILAKKPYLIIDMPHYNYMQSYLTSLSVLKDFEVDKEHRIVSRKKKTPYCWRGFWFWDEDKIANTLIEMLTNQTEANKRTEQAFDTFMKMHENPDTNFFKVFNKLIGYTS